MSERLLTVPEAAELLSLSKQATYRLIQYREIDHYKLGARRIGISRDQIDNYLQKHLIESK